MRDDDSKNRLKWSTLRFWLSPWMLQWNKTMLISVENVGSVECTVHRLPHSITERPTIYRLICWINWGPIFCGRLAAELWCLCLVLYEYVSLPNLIWKRRGSAHRIVRLTKWLKHQRRWYNPGRGMNIVVASLRQCYRHFLKHAVIPDGTRCLFLSRCLKKWDFCLEYVFFNM